ncbi:MULTISPECIES: hypothetical protein [Pseudomonadati]|uniref:Uncharacterized protein n=1 Tax=Shewanella aestuarii TaxID=1028752 RepID=A0ABT0L1U5_9GAMM|nr:hypothetical protein [Shewanella aestuarii]MCL1117702.1 hypothetical protein [Shewanella aestuarii]GGN76544.1 hypothetical protein GCM10009193_17970 [Shewanella aestuarii]
MSINATVFGQLFIVWLAIATIIIAVLAKRKTQSPILVTVIGFIASFIPLISIGMMIMLALKNDIHTPDSKTASSVKV